MSFLVFLNAIFINNTTTIFWKYELFSRNEKNFQNYKFMCNIYCDCFLICLVNNCHKFQVQDLKEKGNNCVREHKYEEAMYHYTLGIKMDPQNYSLYSNRSLVFLRMQQYHLSMEDALMTIQIKPDWTKVREKTHLYCYLNLN